MPISAQRYELAQKAHKGHWEKKLKGNSERLKRTGEYWRQHVAFLKNHIEFTSNYKVLDIGCGPCGLINYLEHGEKYGLDPLMDYLLQSFDMSKDIKWVKGQGEDLPFQNSFFDLIISTNALDHTLDPQKILVEMRRALKEQRFLFLTVDTSPWWSKAIKMFLEGIGKGDSRHPHAFTRRDIKRILNESGFKIVEAFDEQDSLRDAIGAKSEENRIPLKPGNKIAKALEIKKERGYLSLLKAFFGLALFYVFQDGRLLPKTHSVFLAVKK